ncbi:excisionase family DNA-binding protein [Bradyrhizobium sp. RDT46]|uniref:excisionase family DNA-binding protein n=1 Tax=Bradyrhizobium sp. RDT46 TaxID=3341829 RepID=UPI0035C77A45
MGAMDKDILTTAEAAKILGVSIRTAQLLIEGGTIPSWKTPGGHRRVYRRDVLAQITGPAQPMTASARVVVIARPNASPTTQGRLRRSNTASSSAIPTSMRRCSGSAPGCRRRLSSKLNHRTPAGWLCWRACDLIRPLEPPRFSSSAALRQIWE